MAAMPITIPSIVSQLLNFLCFTLLIEKEIKSLNAQLLTGKEKMEALRIKEKELDEREKNDAELHKILENKRIMLEAKENPARF